MFPLVLREKPLQGSQSVHPVSCWEDVFIFSVRLKNAKRSYVKRVGYESCRYGCNAPLVGGPGAKPSTGLQNAVHFFGERRRVIEMLQHPVADYEIERGRFKRKFCTRFNEESFIYAGVFQYGAIDIHSDNFPDFSFQGTQVPTKRNRVLLKETLPAPKSITTMSAVTRD